MKNKLIFLLVIAFHFCRAQNVSQDIEIVKQIMMIQENNWNNGNIQGFMQDYWHSDSLKFVGRKGITYGWQNTFDNYLKSYPDKTSMGKLKFKIEYAKQLSETSIYIIGKWDLEKDKPVGGYFTLLWQRIDGKWVIVVDHTS